jgi:adenosylmethionine-8-amino-7-oxononanoate aminotransferase
MDKTWIHAYDPDTKEQSKEWRYIGSEEVPDTEIFKQGVGIYLWEKDGNLLIDYMGKGATITTKYCVALLDKLMQQLVSKRLGKLSKGILFLQSNAVHYKVAITHQKLADLLKHPAPSDYCLFPNLKKVFKH